MALDSRYIVDLVLQDGVFDKDTGAPLSGGLVYFYEDESRTTPKLVYQLTGAPPNYTYTPLPNPIVLSSIGVPVDDNGNQQHIYYYPYDEEGNLELYYISVYSSLGVNQFTLQAWPNITAEDNPENLVTNFQNEIANSQFSQILFNADIGLVLSSDVSVSSQVYPIAPGWDVVISSTGAFTLTIQQVALAGSLGIDTNPPYYLSFLPAGSTISSYYLRQTLYDNPSIFSTTEDFDGYLSGTMLISSLDGLSHTIEMEYAQSSGGVAQTIVTGSTGSAGHVLVQATVLLNSGSNTSAPPSGQSYINIILPNTGYVTLTSIQVVGLSEDQSTINYQQEPVNRQISELYYYYGPFLQYKPIPSYLVGWDFPLNPSQFGSSGSLGSHGANTAAYVWDQTIVYQSVSNSVSFQRDSIGFDGLQLTTTASTKLAVIQYLEREAFVEILNNPTSVNINMASTSNTAGLLGTVTLLYCTDSTLPNLNDNDCVVASLNSDGSVATTNGTWVTIPTNTTVNASFEMAGAGAGIYSDYGLSYFQVESASDALSVANYFAIVVGFSTIPSGESLYFESISLVPGKIATRPAPQAQDEVLRECQPYFEKSWDVGTAIGSIVLSGSLLQPQVLISNALYAGFIYINYKQPKITTGPTVSIYPAFGSGTTPNATFFINDANTFPSGDLNTNPFNIEVTNGNWIIYAQSESGIIYWPTINTELLGVTSIGNSSQGMVNFHYTSDARLGIAAGL